MDKKYICNTCVYETDRLFNYKIHLKTKRHIAKVQKFTSKKSSKKDDISSKNEDRSSKKDEKTRKCEYCANLYSYKNIARHLKTCKKKPLHEVTRQITSITAEKKAIEKQKQQLAKEKEAIEKEKTYIKIRNEILENDLKELKNDYNELIKEVVLHTNSKKTTINMFYIMNNFTEARNFDDLMRPPLTDKEMEEQARIGDVLQGSVRLIANRCINNLKVQERPLHCVDTARNKYLLRHSNRWIVDPDGDRIISTTYRKMHSIYLKDIEDCSDIDKTMKTQQQLLKFGKKKNQQKIIKDLNTKLDIKSINVSDL